MAHIMSRSLSRAAVQSLVAAAGMAALSWEVIWQLKASLALGVSAWGAALTLAVTMGGLCAGSLLMGHILKDRIPACPARLYGALELAIGLSGLTLGAAFRTIESLDSWVYATAPGSAAWAHLLGVAAVLGVPTLCMGATLPLFGLMARQYRTSIAVLYGLNTLGAAAGVLLAAFLLIPQFGVAQTGWIAAAVNIAVAVIAWMLPPGAPAQDNAPVPALSRAPPLSPAEARLVVLVTGFATFALEVAWFRSLTAAFCSTADAFAVMLASVLIALGVAAQLAPLFKKKHLPLGALMAGAGIAILLATPVIERFDYVAHLAPPPMVMNWFIMTLFVTGIPVVLLGVGLPWILDEQDSPRGWSRLYALNTLAAIFGSLSAAWLLLPAIGFARTAWLTGILVAGTGLWIAPRHRRLLGSAAVAAAMLIAVTGESGVGRTRAQGRIFYPSHKLLEFYEGPEATIAAVEYDNGARGLVIDGFLAAAQFEKAHYMAWMGHLPMLLHPDPKTALVICFGTGQTLNAVRQENPQALDIVDINPRVFKLAHHFAANQGVLDDPRVHKIVMDGRAYMRRTEKIYDVITLEPMPPNFAGVNALYSKEFYELARRRLGPNGVIAQWVSFWLDAPNVNASIARTFQEMFPNAALWVDPISKTGVILGSMNAEIPIGVSWPGFARTGTRDLAEPEVRRALRLDRDGVRRYGAHGAIISDDNQLLAYGKAVQAMRESATLHDDNLARLEQIVRQAP